MTRKPTPPPEHLFISDSPIKLGQMAKNDRYATFSALCENMWKYRSAVHPREHWNTGSTKPTCSGCGLIKTLLRANVAKDARATFTTGDLRALMQRINAQQELHT